jgi:hypothetical protein
VKLECEAHQPTSIRCALMLLYLRPMLVPDASFITNIGVRSFVSGRSEKRTRWQAWKGRIDVALYPNRLPIRPSYRNDFPPTPTHDLTPAYLSPHCPNMVINLGSRKRQGPSSSYGLDVIRQTERRAYDHAEELPIRVIHQHRPPATISAEAHP